MDIGADEFREAKTRGLFDFGDGPGAVGAEISFLGDGAVGPSLMRTRPTERETSMAR